MIYIDKERLQQVILNLQSNALKFTSQGSVTIFVSIRQSYLNVEVVDTGVGISKTGIKNLFSVFGKLQDSLQINKKGIGLGLMIS